MEDMHIRLSGTMAAFAEEHEDVPHSPRPIGEEEAEALALLHLVVPNGRD